MILESAIAWFARVGYDGSSLRGIARDAGVDQALITRHYGSKAGLWRAVVDHLAEGQREILPRLIDISNHARVAPATAMKQFIRYFANRTWDLPEATAFALREAGNPGERFQVIKRELAQPFYQACRPVFEAAQAAEVIRTSDIDLFMEILFAAIIQPTLTSAMASQKPAGEQHMHQVVEEVIRLFMVESAGSRTPLGEVVS